MATEKLIDELRAAALEGPSDSVRLHDAKQNVAHSGEAVVGELDPLLSDSSVDVREAAADVLEAVGSQSAYDKLVEFSLRHLEDPTHQTKFPGPGWKRLRRLGKPILAPMARQYRSSLPNDTRLAMIFITQQIGATEGRPLIDRALTESDPAIIEAAGEALGAVDGPGAYDRLLELLNSTNDRRRVGAVRGFERLGNTAAVRPLLQELISANQPVPSSGTSSPEAAKSFRSLVADAIDAITGESLRGDVRKIGDWLNARSI